jgi:hypothetical protein
VVSLEGNIAVDRHRISQPEPTTRYIQTPASKKWGQPLQGPNTTKKARMEQMRTSDEEYQTFWGHKHEQRSKVGNTLMGTMVMGPTSTETTDVRPYIQLPALVNGQTYFLTFLIDTGSEITITTSVLCPEQQDPIQIQGECCKCCL